MTFKEDWMNPYLLAVVASVCFGIVVFPWQATLRAFGFGGFMCVTGAVYLLTGSVVYMLQGIPNRPAIQFFWVALLTAGLYALALTICSFVFTRPGINLVIAATIVAAYPAWTALISTMFLGQPMSFREAFFLVMVLFGIVGLSLSTKPLPEA